MKKPISFCHAVSSINPYLFLILRLFLLIANSLAWLLIIAFILTIRFFLFFSFRNSYNIATKKKKNRAIKIFIILSLKGRKTKELTIPFSLPNYAAYILISKIYPVFLDDECLLCWICGMCSITLPPGVSICTTASRLSAWESFDPLKTSAKLLTEAAPSIKPRTRSSNRCLASGDKQSMSWDETLKGHVCCASWTSWRFSLGLILSCLHFSRLDLQTRAIFQMFVMLLPLLLSVLFRRSSTFSFPLLNRLPSLYRNKFSKPLH